MHGNKGTERKESESHTYGAKKHLEKEGEKPENVVKRQTKIGQHKEAHSDCAGFAVDDGLAALGA